MRQAEFSFYVSSQRTFCLPVIDRPATTIYSFFYQHPLRFSLFIVLSLKAHSVAITIDEPWTAQRPLQMPKRRSCVLRSASCPPFCSLQDSGEILQITQKRTTSATKSFTTSCRKVSTLLTRTQFHGQGDSR